MGKRTCSLLTCRRQREGMVPLTAPVYSASVDQFMQRWTCDPPQVRTLWIGNAFDTPTIPTQNAVQCGCLFSWLYGCLGPWLTTLATTERGSHCIIRTQKKIKIQNSKYRFSFLPAAFSPLWEPSDSSSSPCENGWFSEVKVPVRNCKVKPPWYSWAHTCWTCLGSLEPSLMRDIKIHSMQRCNL